jgi:hypothetical protein
MTSTNLSRHVLKFELSSILGLIFQLFLCAFLVFCCSGRGSGSGFQFWVPVPNQHFSQPFGTTVEGSDNYILTLSHCV